MTTPATTSPRWIKVALGISLAINFLVIGFAAGAAYKWKRGPHGGFQHRVERFLARVDAPKRAEVRGILEARQNALRPLRRQMRQSRRDLRDALVAQTFDEPAFIAAGRAFVSARTALYEKRLTYVPQLARLLSADEREALARTFARRRGRRGRRRSGDGD